MYAAGSDGRVFDGWRGGVWRFELAQGLRPWANRSSSRCTTQTRWKSRWVRWRRTRAHDSRSMAIAAVVALLVLVC